MKCSCGNELVSREAVCERCDVPVVLPHRSILKRETSIAQSHEAAENVYTMLENLSILPPEFKGNYLMQSRLIAGIAGTIEKILNPKET